MDRLLRKYPFCRAFIDDIVIFSDSAKEHLEHLRVIFGLFVEMNIALSPKKAYVGYPSVDLLSFRVNSLGLSITDERLKAFSKLAFPR